MKTLNLKYLLFLVFTFFALATNSTLAQKRGKKKKKKAKTTKTTANKNGSDAAIMVRLSEMSREEKNTMSDCPLHKKHMSLSDNYRADASDFTISENTPFAYQLNYRRYCNVCTRIMDKEEQDYKDKVAAHNSQGATFERCEVHNQQLNTNPDFNAVNVESNPNTTLMPHARQYRFSTYCKVCTKIFKIEEKSQATN